jgi:ABC-type glycerol-3-phosphate transport system substrate-binding protein
MKKLLLALVVAIATAFAAGCGKSNDTTTNDVTAPETETAQEKESAIEEIVETVTGAKQIEEGKKAEEKIKAIQEEQTKKLNEALDL